VSAVPPVRPDLDLAAGYHSPQVEAEVRLKPNDWPSEHPDRCAEDQLAPLLEASSNR